MLSYLLDLIIYCVCSVINFLIVFVAGIISFLIKLLPMSPFLETNVNFLSDVSYIKWFEWIIPLTSILGTIQLFIIAFASYYVIKFILAWLKLI